MRRCAAILAVVLALPVPARAHQASAPPPPSTATPAPADPSSTADPPTSTSKPAAAEAETVDPDLARIRRGLASPTRVRDAAESTPPATFRISITEKVDIGKFWGADKSAVAASVRPSGGPWHHEFVNMVTPDEFKGYGGILSNGEKLQLAATSLAFAGALQLISAGIGKAKGALDDRARNEAKDEVQRELEAFFRQHPETRTSTPLAPDPVP